MNLFIQAAHAAPEAASGSAMIMQWIFPLAIFAIFYFLVIRPQSKRAKEHRNMVDSLTVGNEVIFAGGLMGKIKSIDGDYAVVALNDKNDVMIQRASVISVLPNGTIDGLQ
ncbi:preprotein translocase subunit YajC [Psychrobacter phenylpyruvicus]|uniref:Sec translocon accessory complex subunit YajC n=1 Tax=Psychrobacter phenylpyruvicus TaxID=29432 RepID=A0A379LKY2_9GAMM|nr:preprotein translocase subunit YajC [Psychrobacter phenylpyruvicus]SUD91091.1 preprotein translocase subunit YajC [Psychrobacter phenylpyruvicus]